MITEKYFPKYPPFDKGPRPGQPEVIEKIHSDVISEKKFFVLAAPTGSGKSVILHVLARAINDLPQEDFNGTNTLITTSQLVLQDQYEKDFVPDNVFVMKGRPNFKCQQPASKDDLTCANGVCLVQTTKTSCSDTCPYKMAKRIALHHPEVITNFAYFLNIQNHYGEGLGLRRVLIVDEAHNIENALMNYVECVISQNILKFCHIDMTLPFHDEFRDYADFLEELGETVAEKIDTLQAQINRRPELVFGEEARQLKRLETLLDKVSFLRFHSRTCRWIADPDEEKLKVSFKPINISQFGQRLVFDNADIIILSSATITPEQVRRLGVEEFEYIEMPSTFPAENRPIYSMNTGRMGWEHLEKTLPKIVEDVDYILDKFPDQKGIVHATSYRISKYIMENTRHQDRLLSHDSSNRAQVLEEHMTNGDPTVLLSPSMTEGIDLKGDKSRFQVIVKIPFASLADKQIKARMREDPVWYASLAATTMMQAYGRSVRSKDDTAITFILDSGFGYFMKRNHSLFCNWFKEAIVSGGTQINS